MAFPSLAAYYLAWGDYVGWEVPDEHVEACDWLENGRKGRVGVLKAFRGFSKSTLVGRHVAHKLEQQDGYRFQVLSATDQDGAKLSRDARYVIENHPWSQRQRGKLWKTHRFEVSGANDPRNPSVSAFGIMSNITGGRADEIINDDVEVPKTVATPALREGLRLKLAEETHIIVPGGKILYVGTDHCVESIYKEQITDGADLLEIPLFRKGITHIVKGNGATFAFDYRVTFASEIFVLVGGLKPRLLPPDAYNIDGLRNFRGGRITLREPLRDQERISIYSGQVWASRFTREEIAFRISKCRTWGEWDSQYQLKAARVGEVRLDPGRMLTYCAEPEIRSANDEISMWLNGIRMVGVATVWDPSLGKISSDTSAVSVVYTDSRGYLYWHAAEALAGDIYQQCDQLVKIAKRLHLPAITVLTTGQGGHIPPVLRGCLQRAGLATAVLEVVEKGNKNVAILDALETPLSGAYLYAHESVANGPAGIQLGEWDPKVLNQPDDYLDTAAKAIASTPVRIGRSVIRPNTPADWRGGTESFTAPIERR